MCVRYNIYVITPKGLREAPEALLIECMALFDRMHGSF